MSDTLSIATQLEPGIGWLLQYATDAMLIAAADGRIVLANPPAERLFGYAGGELAGRPVDELIPQRLRGRHAGLRRQYAGQPRARGMGTGSELYGRRANGAEFPVEVSLSPLQPAGGAALVLATVHDISQRVRAEQALRQSQAELRRLSAHQEQVKEQERKRIAQEIHDELGALLTGIKAHISVAMARQTRGGAPPGPLLAEALALGDAAIQSVRRVITDLRPSVLDQLGIWAALEWYAGQIAERSGLACSCAIAPQLQALELDPQRSIMVFRVVQEALTNVAKHAGAKTVVVRLGYGADALSVQVDDDGRGGDAPPGTGIRGMAERARALGGELTAAPREGGGYRVRARLPVR